MKPIEKKQQKTAPVVVLAGVVLIIGITTAIYPAGSAGPLAAYAAAQSTTTVEDFPVDETDFVPCAAGGAGEEVHLTGKIHVVIHSTLDGAGGAHVKLHASDQGISGTGLTTGDKYQRTGATNIEFNAKVGFERSAGATFNWIGQGNGNNFLVHVLFHVTVNPDGSVTALVDKFSIECK